MPERFPYPWYLHVPPPTLLSSLPDQTRVLQGAHQDPRAQDGSMLMVTTQQFIPSQLTCVEPIASDRRTITIQKKHSTTMITVQSEPDLQLELISRAPYLLCRLRAYADPEYKLPAQVPNDIEQRNTYQLTVIESPRGAGLVLDKAFTGYSHWFAEQSLREPKTVHDNHGIRSEMDRQLVVPAEFILRVRYDI